MASRVSVAGNRLCPSTESPRGSYVAMVKENRRICTDHYRLVLHLPSFPRSAPGQFIQLDCRDPHAAPVESDVHDLGPRSFDWPPAAGESRPVPSDPDFTAPLA